MYVLLQQVHPQYQCCIQHTCKCYNEFSLTEPIFILAVVPKSSRKISSTVTTAPSRYNEPSGPSHIHFPILASTSRAHPSLKLSDAPQDPPIRRALTTGTTVRSSLMVEGGSLSVIRSNQMPHHLSTQPGALGAAGSRTVMNSDTGDQTAPSLFCSQEPAHLPTLFSLSCCCTIALLCKHVSISTLYMA